MSSAFTTAPPPSNSAPASMETLLATIGRVVAKFEARLEAQEQRRATAFPPSRSEFDLSFGRPRTSWDLPEPPQKPAYSESYGGGDGYSNNYNDYHNNEPQAWFYNTYEPPPSAQYYSVVEPPQQPHSYYPQPPLDEVRPSLGFWQPSLAPPQQLLPTQLAPWEAPWYRTAPDSSAGDPQPEGCTEWQPMTSVYGLSTDSQQNAPSSVPVTSNEEDEFEKWQGEVREAETKAEVEIEAGLDTKTEDEFVSGVVKTEEEFVSDVEATLEVGEEPASGSSKSLLQAILLSPTDGDLYGVEQIELNVRGEEVASDPQIEKIEGKSRVVEDDNISSKLSCDSKLNNKPLGEAEYEEYILVNAELREGDIKLEDVFLEVTRRLVIFGLYALAEVYKDLHLEDKVFEYWVGRGMLQIFVAVMTRAYPEYLKDHEELFLLQSIASYILLACGVVYIISGMFCIGMVKRARQKKEVTREQAIKDLEELERRREELESLLVPDEA